MHGMSRPAPPTYAKFGVTDMTVAMNLRVFLDAVEQSCCVEYDTEAGYVVRYVVLPTDSSIPQFKIVIDEVATERVEGIVEVMWRDGPE